MVDITKREEYQGASADMVGHGQSDIDGQIGGMVGGAIGAGLGALSHNEEVAKVAKTIRNTHDLVDALKTDVAPRIKDPEKLRKARQELENITKYIESKNIKPKGFGTWFHAQSRGMKALVAGAIGATALGAITGITGYVRGEKKGHAGKEQFDRITSQNEALRQQVASLEAAQETPQKSFIATEQNRRDSAQSKQDGPAL